MPFVNHEVEVFQVALLVEREVAGRSVEGVAAQGFGHLGGVGAAGFLDTLGNDLNSGVGREHERAARVLLLRLECVDQLLVARILIERLRQGDQQAFGSRACNGGDFLVAYAFRAHEADIQALFLRLTQQQAQLWVIAAVVDEVDILLLELGDHRGEVLVASVDALEQANLDAFLLQGFLDRGRDPFAVLLLVVDDGNIFRLDGIGDEVTGGRALQAVQTDGAEDQLVATRGDVRAGRRCGNHQNAFVFIDIGRRLGGAGAEVTYNEADLVVNDLVGNRHGLLGVAGVVINDTFKLLTVDATFLVDLFDGHLGTDELHVPVLRDSPGNRTGQADLDVVGGQRVARCTRQSDSHE